ncbi:hypothetical protein B0H12DRAFT_1067551 [Mycena haematopus]|nr:hypothetical protein B0H12DRAFT_1067551 [Mycena haematopus]
MQLEQYEIPARFNMNRRHSLPGPSPLRNVVYAEDAQHAVFAVIAPPKNNSAPITRLPNEMLSTIFSHFCAGNSLIDMDTISFYAHNNAVHLVRKVCRDWQAVADSTPILWCKLYINCATPPSYTASHISRIKALPLDVYISLDPISEDSDDGESDHSEDSYFDYSLDLSDCYENARGSLEVAKKSLHLWRNVEIHATTHISLCMLLELYGDAPAPNIQSFSFSCAQYGANRLLLYPFLIKPPRIFGGYLPKLTTLRLLSATLPWGEAAYFGQLEMLELQYIPLAARPPMDAFIASLALSHNLRMLDLRGGGVVISGVVPQFTMPALEILMVEYVTSAAGIIDVLRAGYFPKLVHFFIAYFGLSAWDSTVLLDFLPQLLTLSITGDDASNSPHPALHAHIPALLRRLSGIIELELHLVGDAYIEQLLLGAAEYCLHLTVLTVTGFHPQLLLDYLNATLEKFVTYPAVFQ